MSEPKALQQRALRAIDERRDALFALSRAIHAKPELAFEEREAAIRLTEFLEGAGFSVERGYRGIETSYRGDAKGRGPGPTVAILQEYDALAEIGHACGHNLIAMIGIAASVGVRAVMDQLPGRVAAIGTPAEEGGGGKVALLRAGGFDDVDVAMMIHPTSGRSLAGRHSLASNRVMVEYRGRAAHAASQPDLGINALDGILQLFNNVNAMRQQLRPDARVHGIITSGGSAANVIPDYAAARFSIRALDRRYQQEVLRRFIACAEGAALATGTQLNVTVNENAGYENMVFSTPIAERWAHHMRAQGVQVFEARDEERVGSTDMGNVMQVLPAIHPYIAVSQDSIPGHSVAFREAVLSQEAHDNALAAAKALALTAIDVLVDPEVLRKARAEFEDRRAKGIVKGRT
ncbi:MAG: M20 family metallopeptidase [Chloroflexi bacterium]|nr:MAG: M20 family metallopeptidase [Chloroflexota bacterium]TMG69770.1 MAG: M20 family metallopeptidase [Chloroflexota bacterium]